MRNRAKAAPMERETLLHNPPCIARPVRRAVICWVLATGVLVGIAQALTIVLGGDAGASLGAGAAGAAGAGSGAESAVSVACSLTFGTIMLFLADCALTGVVEEVLFRGVLFGVLRKALRSRGKGVRSAGDRCDACGKGGSGDSADSAGSIGRADYAGRAAVFLQAAIFGLVHLIAPWPAGLTGVALLQGLLKVTAAWCFGVCMARIGLVRAMLVHIAYDIVAFLPVFFLVGEMPMTYFTGIALDLVPLVVSLLLIMPAVLGERRV